MIGPASVQDLTARSLRPLSTLETTVAGVLLDDAYARVVARVPSVAGWVSDPDRMRLVVQVQCAMVLRVLGNPDGKLEETIDDYRYRLDAAVSSGALYVSDAEAALLGSTPGMSDGAFTIRPAGIGPVGVVSYDQERW